MPERLDQEVQRDNYAPVRQFISDLTRPKPDSSSQIRRIQTLLEIIQSSHKFLSNQSSGFIYNLRMASVKDNTILKGPLKIGAFVPQSRNENLLKSCSPFHHDFYHPNDGLIRLKSSNILSKSPSKSHIFFHQVHGTSLNSRHDESANNHALHLQNLVQCPGMLCLNNCSQNASRIENAKDYSEKLSNTELNSHFSVVSVFNGKLPVYLADDFTRLILNELWDAKFIFEADSISYELLFFKVIRKLMDLYLPFIQKNHGRASFERAYDHIYSSKIKSGELSPRIFLKDFFAPLNYQLIVRNAGQLVPKPILFLNDLKSQDYYMDLGLSLIDSDSKKNHRLNIKRYYQFPELHVSSRLKYFSHQLHNLVSTNGQFIQTRHGDDAEQYWLFIPPFGEVNSTEDLSTRLIRTLKNVGTASINLLIQSNDPDDHLARNSHLTHWIKRLNEKLKKYGHYRWVVIHKPHRIGIRDLHPEKMQLLLPANLLNLIKMEYSNSEIRSSARLLLDNNYYNPVDLINCAILRQCGLQLSYADYKHLIPLHFSLILRDLLRGKSAFSKTVLKSTLEAVFSNLPSDLIYLPQLKEYRLLGLALIAQRHGFLQTQFFMENKTQSPSVSVFQGDSEFFQSGFPKSCQFILTSLEEPLQFRFEFEDFDPLNCSFKKVKTKINSKQQHYLNQVTGGKQKPRITNYKADEETYTLNKALMAGLRAVVEACLID